jgi:hypothetical protein
MSSFDEQPSAIGKPDDRKDGFSDEADVEGHMALGQEGAPGVALGQEGAPFARAAKDDEDDDTEGHSFAARAAKDDEDDDTEGHVFY